MKSFVAVMLFVSAVVADRLENTYLPPHRSQSAGGSGSFLSTPFKSAPSRSPISSYIPPAAGPVAPNGLYGAPAFKTASASSPAVRILKYNNDNNGEGSYRFEYETENQISHQETGELRNTGGAELANTVHGSYSFTAPDGITYTVNYVADENGYRATGDHIPTPPPVPAAIQKSLNSGYQTGASVNRQYLAPRVPQNNGYSY